MYLIIFIYPRAFGPPATVPNCKTTRPEQEGWHSKPVHKHSSNNKIVSKIGLGAPGRLWEAPWGGSGRPWGGSGGHLGPQHQNGVQKHGSLTALLGPKRDQKSIQIRCDDILGGTSATKRANCDGFGVVLVGSMFFNSPKVENSRFL